MQDNATATVTEIRAEVLKTVAGHDEERRGLTDRLAVGRCVAADIVGGVEEVEVRGALTDHSDNNSMSVAKRFRFDVGGKLTLRGHADTFLVGGRMNENFVGGTLLLAGMSDDMVIGPGARVTAPLDITAAGLLAMEEKIGSAFADGALQEYAALCYEREYGPGAHACTTAVFSGQVHTTQATTFKPMVKTLSGVVNLTPGSGAAGGDANGGDANGGAHAPAAPGAPGGSGAGGSALVAASTSGGDGENTGDLAVAAAQTDDMAALAEAEDTRAANQGAEADLLAQVRAGQADDIGQTDEAGQADEFAWKEYDDRFYDNEHRREYETSRTSAWTDAQKRAADEVGDPYQDEAIWMVGPDGKLVDLADEFTREEIGTGPTSASRIGADMDLDDPASWGMWPPQWETVPLDRANIDNVKILPAEDGGQVRYMVGDEVYTLPAGARIDEFEFEVRLPGGLRVSVSAGPDDAYMADDGVQYLRVGQNDQLRGPAGQNFVLFEIDGEIQPVVLDDLARMSMDKPSGDVYFLMPHGDSYRPVSTFEASVRGPGSPEYTEFMALKSAYARTGENALLVEVVEEGRAQLNRIKDIYGQSDLQYLPVTQTNVRIVNARPSEPVVPPRLYGVDEGVAIGDFDDAVWKSTLGGAVDEGHVAGDPPPLPTSEAAGDAPRKSRRRVKFKERVDDAGGKVLDVRTKEYNPTHNVFDRPVVFGPADDAMLQREALDALHRINGEMADFLEFRMDPGDYAKLDLDDHQALLDAVKDYEYDLHLKELLDDGPVSNDIDGARLAGGELSQAELDKIDRMDWSSQVQKLRERWKQEYIEEVHRFIRHQPNTSWLPVEAQEAIGAVKYRGRERDLGEATVAEVARNAIADAIRYLEEVLAGQRSPFAQDLVAADGAAASTAGADDPALVYAAVNGNEDAFELLKRVLPDSNDRMGVDQSRGSEARRAKAEKKARGQLQHVLESLTAADRDIKANLNPVARLQQRAQDYGMLYQSTGSRAVLDASGYSSRMAGALDSLARKYGKGDAFAFFPEDLRVLVDFDVNKLDTFVVAEDARVVEDAAAPPPVPPKKGAPKAPPEEQPPPMPRKKHKSLTRTKGQGRSTGLANAEPPAGYDFSAGLASDNAADAAARVEVAPLPPPDIDAVPLNRIEVEVPKPDPIYDDIDAARTYARPAPGGGRPKPDLGPKVADSGANASVEWEAPPPIPKKKKHKAAAAAPVPPPRSSTPPAVATDEWRKIEDAKPTPKPRTTPPASPTPKPRTSSFGSATTPPAQIPEDSALRRVFGATADAEGATVSADDAAFPSGTVSGTVQDMVRKFNADADGYDDTVKWAAQSDYEEARKWTGYDSQKNWLDGTAEDYEDTAGWSQYQNASGWGDDADDLDAYTSLKEFMTPPDTSNALRGTAGGAADGGQRAGQREVAQTFRRAFDESASAGEPIYATFDWGAIKAEEDVREAAGTLKRPTGAKWRVTRTDRALDSLDALNAYMDETLAAFDGNRQFTTSNVWLVDANARMDQARQAAKQDLDRARTGLRYLLAEIVEHLDGVEDARAWDGDGDDAARRADMMRMRRELGSLTLDDLHGILVTQSYKARDAEDANMQDAIKRVIDAYYEQSFRIKMAEMQLTLDEAAQTATLPASWRAERVIPMGGDHVAATDVLQSEIKTRWEDAMKRRLHEVLPNDRLNFYAVDGPLDGSFGMLPSEAVRSPGASPDRIRALPSRGMDATDPLSAADRAAHEALSTNKELVFVNDVYNRAVRDAGAGINPLARIDLQIAYLEDIAKDLDPIIPEGELSVAKRLEYLMDVRKSVAQAGDKSVKFFEKSLGFERAATLDVGRKLDQMWQFNDGMQEAFLAGDPYWARAGSGFGYRQPPEGAVDAIFTNLQAPPPIPPKTGAPPVPPRIWGFSLR